MLKLIFTTLLSAFIFHFSFLQFAEAAPKMKIFRSGHATVGLGTDWPDHLKIPSSRSDGKYKPRWLKREELQGIPSSPNEQTLKTWDPDRFTYVTGVPTGTEFERFHLIVHGFELSELVHALSEGLDILVNQYLEPRRAVPYGADFIPYYPYFFHKKTIVSGSVISENLTATFGRCGLLLSVPAKNILAASRSDMHSPEDAQFYPSYQPGFADLFVGHLGIIQGIARLTEVMRRFPLPPLDDLLPRLPVDTQKTVSKNGPKAVKSESLKKQPFPQIMTQAGLVQSWYNEVALTPIGLSATRENPSEARIIGLFFRSDQDEASVQASLGRKDVQHLLELGEALNLPIIQIYDGQYYETAL